MRQIWDRARVITVLAAIKDAGISVPVMSRRSGVTRSTIYRWMAGEVQPDYNKVYSLAYAVWPRQPRLARELVEASGYAWAEPAEAPGPPPIPDDVMDVIRKNYPPEKQAEIIEMLAELSERDVEPGPGDQSQRPGGATGRAG